MYVTDNGNNWGPNGRLIGTHLLLQDWTEGNGWNVGNNIAGTGDGTTWNCPIDNDISNNQDDCATQWGGGNFAAIPGSTTLITNSIINQYVEFDVTNDVQSFVDGTETNYGWMVKKDDEAQNGTIEFASKELATNIPELVIVVNLSQAEILFNQQEDLVSELDLISQVSDESVVADYLVDSISNLKTDTQTLVTDIDTRNTLISILDSALQSANDAGSSVLALDESSANQKISESKNFVDSYATQVSAFSGTVIPTTDADFLIAQANQISTDSLKRDLDSGDLISGTPLTFTSQILDLAKSDAALITAIGNQLISLGFTADIQVQTASPTTGIVTFSNTTTLQDFSSEVSDLALAALAAIITNDDAISQSLPISDEELAALMISLPVIVSLIQDTIVVPKKEALWLYLLCRVHPYATAACVGVAVGTAIGIYLQLEHPEIVQLIHDTIANAPQAIVDAFIEILLPPPELEVIKQVVNLFGGTAIASDFTIQIINNGAPLPNIPGSEEGIVVTLAQGTYSADELPASEYQSTKIGCSGDILQGQRKTCTITNTDIAPTLTVIKNIINDDGGTLTLSEVTLRVNGNVVTSGEENILVAGTYQVSEDPIADYNTSFSGDCDAGGFVTLDVGDDKTCTITNDDVSPAVFFEDFDDGDISDWLGFNAGCIATAICRINGVLPSALGEDPPSEPFWGRVAVRDTGAGSCRSNIGSHISQFFTVPEAGDYEVSADLVAFPIAGANISTRVIIDGNIVLEHTGQNTGQVPLNITEAFSFGEKDIIPLAAGSHLIQLRMQTNFMCFGTFNSAFDNVSITPVGSQATSSSASIGGPYFYSEINQTSVNATKPIQVTIPLKVEWLEGWYAEPVSVELLIGNGTNNGISGTVTSVQNATMYKLFDLTFDISNSTQVGQEDIGILVTELETGDTNWETLIFNISE